jgi:holo-[acyl-carrier protein] synthase
MAQRLFTEQERLDAAERPERLAARFAAKEAVLKALSGGLGDATFRSIEVCREDSGAPHIVLHGAALALARARGVEQLHLSISHTEVSATAFVVASSEVARAG